MKSNYLAECFSLLIIYKNEKKQDIFEPKPIFLHFRDIVKRNFVFWISKPNPA